MFYFYSLSLIFAYIVAFFFERGGDGGMVSLIISAIFRLLDHATKIEKARRSTQFEGTLSRVLHPKEFSSFNIACIMFFLLANVIFCRLLLVANKFVRR